MVMSFPIDDAVSSTDDSSTSRPLSGVSIGRAGDNASWEMLERQVNVEKQGDIVGESESEGETVPFPDQSFATIRSASLGCSEDVLGLQTGEIAKSETPQPSIKPIGGTKVADLRSVLMAVAAVMSMLLTGYVARHGLWYLYWIGRINMMHGLAEDIPANEYLFDLHNSVCSKALAMAQLRFNSCTAVAESFDNKLYLKSCHKEYVDAIRANANFCGWNEGKFIESSFSAELHRLAKASGQNLAAISNALNKRKINLQGALTVANNLAMTGLKGYTSLVHMLQANNINVHGAHILVSQLAAGAQQLGTNIAQHTHYTLNTLAMGLANIGTSFNLDRINAQGAVKDLCGNFLENAFKGSQQVIEGSANVVKQSFTVVKNLWGKLF